MLDDNEFHKNLSSWLIAASIFDMFCLQIADFLATVIKLMVELDPLCSLLLDHFLLCLKPANQVGSSRNLLILGVDLFGLGFDFIKLSGVSVLQLGEGSEGLLDLAILESDDILKINRTIITATIVNRFGFEGVDSGRPIVVRGRHGIRSGSRHY